MKKQILNIGKTLSRAELQKINGGAGTCKYYNSQSNCIQIGLSSSQAQGLLAHPDDHWCCESCDTTSWGTQPQCGGPKKPITIISD